ncbi:autotransporter outer membrane beta-barrel domain-containing protein [Phreatobacter stygius]|uniref:autotransporter outer membrane beta-barrel domain-containing protein n=1 Tax=Phreatobacter stygius TaxID=1940610 RepID=UPI001476BF95|nr:autotransporter domain-containing protein [Phreatobacter stygius]
MSTSGDVDPLGATSPTWTISRQLTIGNSGSGSMTIAGGGRVSSSDGLLGFYDGSAGTATVTGAGSTWTNAGELIVGILGSGALTISGGATVANTMGSLGLYTGSTGAVTVTGAGSTWTNSGELVVGWSGTSTLAVGNGGAVASGKGSIGYDNDVTGTVTVHGAGSTWSASAIDLGVFGAGVLTIAEGGKVSVGTGGSGIVTLASYAAGTGTVNIGAVAGSPAVAAGTLAAAELRFGNGTGTLNFNHTDGAYVFAPKVSGHGTIEQRAGTTILTGDSSGFAGQTTVSGGKLVVNGALGGTLSLASGGVLGGSGTVGGLTVKAGGTVAPGNSLGTLNVSGHVGFAAGSRYQVEINPAGQGDRIVADGTAVLSGGTVDVVKAPGTYLPGTRYTILTAAGGVTGTFASFGQAGLFISLGLSYDTNNVYLDLARNQASFASVGATRNQAVAATAAEALGRGHVLYDALVQLTRADAARAAFDQLSGEIHASARTALVEDSRFLREAAINRLRAAFGAAGATRAPVAVYAADGPVSAAASTERFAVWGQAFGSWGRWSGDGNAARLNRSTGGFLIGADGSVLDIWRLGIVAGYSRTDFAVRERGAAGSSDNYHAGLYGGTQWGQLALRAGAAYTWHDIATSRSVALPGLVDNLKGGYKAGSAQVFGELGYGITLAQTPIGILAIEPFANLAYVSLSTAAFAEKPDAVALVSSGAASGLTFTTLGLHGATGFMLGSVSARARGTLGWRHAFGDTVPAARLAFAGGTPFGITGVPIARNAAVVEAGLDFNLTPAATLGFTYGGQFGSGLIDQTAKANFNVRF